MANSDRVLHGRIGAYTVQARHDSHALTERARRAFESKFERDVDPDGVLEPAERLRRAEMTRKAHFARLALASAQARRKKHAPPAAVRPSPPPRPPAPINTAYRDRFNVLRELGAAHAADACRALGVPYALADERLRRIVPGGRLAGTAVTLRLHLVEGSRSYLDGAFDQFGRGRSVEHPVLLFRNEVPGFDTLGSFDARLARASGYDGYVVDGPVRDTDALTKMRFPVFATSVRADCIRLADLPAGVSIAFDFESPIDVGGVRVERGMAVVADGDGVMVFAADRLDEVIETAADLANREARLIARLDAGGTVDEVLRMAASTSEAERL